MFTRTFPPRRFFTTSTTPHKIYENISTTLFQTRVLSPTGPSASTPVLVDFYAPWCQPCKLLSPSLKLVASQPSLVNNKQIDLVTINVDQHQNIAKQFNVSAMPTVIAMKNGKVLDRFVGLLPEKKVIEFVKNLK